MNAESTRNQASAVLGEDPLFPEYEDEIRRKLDFLGFAPCPIRGEMRRRLHRLFRDHVARGGREPRWFVPSGCHEPTVYDDVWRTEDFSELPSLIAEAGFGGFNQPSFVERWLDESRFARFSNLESRPEFHEAGLVDEKGFHYVYNLLPEVFLVDRRRLGDRPAPASWADLLHPRYENDIVIGGQEGKLRESLLFGFYKDFGLEGLEALGRNTKDFMHPSLMAKSAGSDNPSGAAIYVLPNFFALATPKRESAGVVWPAEGAYAMPCYLMQKRDAPDFLSLARDFLTGPEWAAHAAKIGFAPAAKESPPLPGPLRWVGWDFVRDNDLEALRQPLNGAFVRGFRTGAD